MGIISLLKVVAPWSIYLAGIVGIALALVGKVRWALMLVLVLAPMRNIVEKMHSMPMGDQFLDLLFLSMIIGWFLSSMTSSKGFMAPNFVNVPALILMGYLFLSMMVGSLSLSGGFGLDRYSSRIQDWKNFTLLQVLFFLIVNNLPDRRWVMRAYWVMIATLTLMAYYIVGQVTSYSSIESRVKISGTFEFLGPNEVAAFLNQTTVILSGIYFCLSKKDMSKYLILGLILAFTYCIIFLYSRGAYVGLLAGMVILFVIKNQKYLIPLVLILVFWQAVLPEKVIERIQGTKNVYGELDESSELRLVMWERGLELFKQSPIFGIGFGVYRLKDFGTGLKDTHNIYIKILAEQGIIGIILFFLVVIAMFRQGLYLYQKGNDDLSRGLGLGLFASMFTLIINNFFGDRWAYFELSAYTWAFVGLAARLSQLNSDKTQELAAAKDPIGKLAFSADTTPVKKTRKSYYK